MADTSITLNSVTTPIWFSIGDLISPVSFIVTGTFSATLAVLWSNNESFNKGTDYVTDDTTYAAPAGPREIPTGVAKFVGFVLTGYTSGAVKVSFAKSANRQGNPVDVSQQTSRSPAPSSQAS